MKTTCFTLTAIATCAFLFSACTETATSTQAGFFNFPSKPKPPPPDPALQSFLDTYDRYFNDSMLQAGPPGAAVVIVKDSQVVLVKGYGEKAFGGHDPVDANTVFRIGSLSKGFSSVLTSILVNKGLLDWTDPVQEYYPAFSLKDKKQAQRVEIRHLLSHTTGLPYQAFGNLIEQGFDLETIAKQYFPTAKLFGREGEFFGYQNTAYSVIGPVLEAVTGKAYQALLAEYIFRPAGMRTASCDYETMLLNGNKALPHVSTKTGWFVDTISPLYYRFAPAGGVNASATDMGKWLLVLLGQKPEVASVAVLDEVFQPVISTGLERRVLPGWIARDSAAYALGWRILATGSDTLVYHSGYVNNFYSEIAFNRREKTGICVLFNGNTSMRGACIREFFEKWKACQAPVARDGLPRL